MSWNNGYFNKYGNQLKVDDINQEVYDGDGKKIGFYSNGTIRSNNGNILASNTDIEKPIKDTLDTGLIFLDMFK